MTNSLTIVSYNILNPFHAVMYKEPNGIEMTADNKVVSNWEKRAPFVAENLSSSHFHVACLQEVSAAQAQFLGKAFTLIAPLYPENDVDKRTFANALAYQPQVLRLEDHFQLTPHAEENARTTPAMMGIFTHLPSQRVVAIVCAHLKGYDPNIKDEQQLRLAKQGGYDQLMQHIAQAKHITKRFGCKAVVFAGDFNEDYHSTAAPNRMHLMLEEGFLHDGCLTVSEPAKNRKIDWIYASGAVLVSDPVSCPHPKASDHLPVASRLEF